MEFRFLRDFTLFPQGSVIYVLFRRIGGTATLSGAVRQLLFRVLWRSRERAGARPEGRVFSLAAGRECIFGQRCAPIRAPESSYPFGVHGGFRGT